MMNGMNEEKRMMSMMSNGYQSVLKNREARIRLTTKCNYRCFFCHEEGGCQAPAAKWGTLLPLLLSLKRQGRTKITFTGGEPLLNKPVLLKALEEIASWDIQPEVTVITNASLLDETVILALEKCQNAKVHVSIHDPRSEEYAIITGQKFRAAEDLKPILRRLSSGPVCLKLNAALTSGFVYDETSLATLLEYAREVGAYTVKFVELLKTKDDSLWPRQYIPVDALNQRLQEEGFFLYRKTLRTYYWRTPSGLIVEGTRCSCVVGCEHCNETRGDSFTGGTHYHPCFLAAKTISMEGRTLEDVLEEGESYLEAFIKAGKVA